MLDIAFAATPLALRSAYHDAWHRGLVTPTQVIEVVERLSRPGRPGGPKLRAMVERYPIEGNPARSLNELRLYDAIYDHSDLPNALLNFRVVRASGVEAFIDLAWPDYMYGVEVDHTETHAERWRHDVIRTEELNDIGWTIDRVMEDHVEHGLAATVARTRRRLIQHGMPS
jgi:very-short-patch-repair endonuclease